MAYIPPHKRYSKVPSPTPDSLSLQFKRNLKLGSGSQKNKMHKYALPGGKVIYGNEAIHMWFAVGTSDIDGHFPSSVHFHPISLKLFHQNEQENALLLLDTNQNSENVAFSGKLSPWAFIAERVNRDLFSCFHRLRKQMPVDNFEVRPSIVARFGKVLFRETPLVSLEAACNRSVTETTLRNLRKAFYTNLPADVDNNVRGVALRMGLLFEENDDVYTVKLSDETQTDSTLSCKCRIRTEDNKLELCKVELNHLRHMVADISCPNKNLDLRLMLCTKRIVTCLTDEEENNIRGILNSATLDPVAKGGLRWPSSGEVSSGGRFRVVGVWHMKATAYRNSSMRLKVRNVDRIDFRTSTGGASTEINLKLKGIVSELQEEAETGLVSDMLKENLKVIWDNFLWFDHSLT